MGIFDFLKIKNDKWWNSLSDNEKAEYIQLYPDSLWAEKEKERVEKEKAKQIVKTQNKENRLNELNSINLILMKFLKIEDSISDKFADTFYLEIKTSNFDEKLSIISKCLPDDDELEVYLTEKIRFFTLYQIFEKCNLMNIDVSLDANKHSINENTTLNELFVIQINNSIDLINQKINGNINTKHEVNQLRTGGKITTTFYMKDLIQSYVIRDLSKIIGKPKVIIALKKLWNRYKFHYSIQRNSNYFVKQNFGWAFEFQVSPTVIKKVKADKYKYFVPYESKQSIQEIFNQSVSGNDVYKELNYILSKKFYFDNL